MMPTTPTTTTPQNPMGFRTLTARFAGICRRCNGPIAVGDTIRYGGKGKTYHFATDCKVQATPAPQPQAQPAPTPAQLMTATIAESLRQTFAGLMALPAKLGDVEPRVVEAPAAAAAEAAAVEAEPEAVTVTAPVAIAPQKAPRPRQAARRKAFVPATMAQPLDPDDLF